MSRFVSQLESRTLFSALPITKATLAADRTAIVADAAALKAEFTALVKANSTQTAVIARYFKGLPKGDGILLKALATVENESKSAFQKEINSLSSVGIKLSSKATAVGNSLLTKASVKSLETASADIAALASVTALPLATLDAHLSSTDVADALSAIGIALPNDAAVVSAISTFLTNAAADKTAIGATANQFSADIANLASDLTAVHTATGTYPDLVGTFSGPAIDTKGADKGQTSTLTLTITSQDANGILEGTVIDAGGVSDSVVGSETLTGAVTLKQVPGTGKDKLTAKLVSGALVGTFAFSTGKGTFSLSEPVI